MATRGRASRFANCPRTLAAVRVSDLCRLLVASAVAPALPCSSSSAWQYGLTRGNQAEYTMDQRDCENCLRHHQCSPTNALVTE